jgi:hypothetical protein
LQTAALTADVQYTTTSGSFHASGNLMRITYDA